MNKTEPNRENATSEMDVIVQQCYSVDHLPSLTIFGYIQSLATKRTLTN